MIWFLGFIVVIGYRLFNAGMKSDSLFYANKMEWTNDYSKKVPVRALEGEKLFVYVAVTIGVALTWPLALPAVGMYLLGKKLAK